MKKLNLPNNYKGVVNNRKVLYETHNRNLKKIKFLGQSIIYFSIIITKFILSRFYKIESINDTVIGINWLFHKTSRFLDYDSNLLIINYNYKRLSKLDVKLFSNLKFIDLIYAFKLSPKTHFRLSKSLKDYSNVFYAFVCLVENLLYKHIIIDHNIKDIYIVGLNDRHSIFISDITYTYGLNLHVLQHGLLTKFDNLHKINVDKFYYTHDFSLKYLKYFLINIHQIECVYLPDKKYNRWEKFDHNLNIAYACTPTNIEYNIEIIKFLIDSVPNDYRVIIYPHPREGVNAYEKYFIKNEKVHITNKRYDNIELLITRISSLGIEYYDIGIKPLFINLENHDTDYLSTGKFEVFESLDAFKDWFFEYDFGH